MYPAFLNFLTTHPRVSFRLVTAATAEPVSTVNAMAHARISESSESGYVATLISSARSHCEMMTGRSLSNEVRRLYSGDWAQFFDLDRTPTASVTSIYYYPEGYGSAVLVDTSYYDLTPGEPDRVQFRDTFNFPALENRQDAVAITYACSAAVIPPQLSDAIKVLVADAYEVRTESVTGTIISKNPRLSQILERHRIGGYAV